MSGSHRRSNRAPVRIAAVLAGAVLVAAGPAAAHEQRPFPDETEALRISQQAVGRTLSDHGFRDRHGRPVRLSDFRGKPLVVNLIYTACVHTCPLIVQHLARAEAAARDALGADSFAILTVGFDVRNDTVPRMRAYAMDRGVDRPGWRFLSADGETIEQLTRELGFVYRPSPQGFDHLAQTTLLDGQGAVYRQIYGSAFEPPALVEPLKELVFGPVRSLMTVSGVINRLRLFCTVYDPSTDRYRFDYSVIIGAVIGAGSLAAVGFVLLRAWRRVRSPANST